MGDKTLNRFGVSLLDKSRHAEAILHEVMIDKETGEVLLKTPGGYFASYDYIARTQSCVERIASICELRGYYPLISKLEVTNKRFPITVADNTSVLGEVLPLANTPNKVLIFVDNTPIKMVSDATADVADTESTVEVVVKYAVGAGADQTKTFTVTNTELNTMIIDYMRLDLTTEEGLKIKSIESIKLRKATSVTGDVKNVLHNVFVCVE